MEDFELEIRHVAEASGATAQQRDGDIVFLKTGVFWQALT